MIRLKLVLSMLASLSKGLALLMFFPLLASFFAHQYKSAVGFAIYLLVLLAAGFGGQKLYKKKEFDELNRLEGISTVVFAWFFAALSGTVPYMYAGMGFVDAFFESMSGFTATGATIITDFSAFESSIFWYRSYTQWLGGMGIMVLFVAVMPHLAMAGRQLFYAETTSASKDKLTPRIAGTARHLWTWYCLLTLLMIACLIFANMSPSDAVCNAFSTIAAGGFSPNSKSIMGYGSKAVEWIVIFFMFLAGANFMLQVKSLKGNKTEFFKNHEFRLYAFCIIFLSLILAGILYSNNVVTGSYIDSLRVALFQNISITTTTGSASQNYDLWPESAKAILVIFMFLGSCSGSAGGGIKIIRLLLLLKYLKRMLIKNIYSQAIINVKVRDRNYKEHEIQPILTFVFMYFLFFFSGGVLLSILENSLVAGFSGAIASLGNIGPGLGTIGPMGTFAGFTMASKLLCIFLMWAGRLEIMVIAIFFKKEVWRNLRW
jgi:trk system potassium uptake protein TrkH